MRCRTARGSGSRDPGEAGGDRIRLVGDEQPHARTGAAAGRGAGGSVPPRAAGTQASTGSLRLPLRDRGLPRAAGKLRAGWRRGRFAAHPALRARAGGPGEGAPRDVREADDDERAGGAAVPGS
mgnify:CR=1 FL=1